MGRARGDKVKFDPDRIVMSGGATGANETIMFCLADRGDAFLVPTPYYPAYVLVPSVFLGYRSNLYFVFFINDYVSFRNITKNLYFSIANGYIKSGEGEDNSTKELNANTKTPNTNETQLQ